MSGRFGILERLVDHSIRHATPLFIVVGSILMGLFALQMTAREEEPQIIVPVMEVIAEAPGLSARQVERQVATPLESLLNQLIGVEYVYSVSEAGRALVTLRFFVGEDRENALLNTYSKLNANQHMMPGAVSQWQVRPVEVDDVPVFVAGLYSKNPDHYDGLMLHRMADEIAIAMRTVQDTSEVKIVGGYKRQIKIRPEPVAMAGRNVTMTDIIAAVQKSNVLVQSGQLYHSDQMIEVEIGDVYRGVDALNNQIIKLIDGLPVYLKDVASIDDTGADIATYHWLQFAGTTQEGGVQADASTHYPMVAISVAKKRGSNAVWVTDSIRSVLSELQTSILPEDIDVMVLRDYGQTADAKVTDLVSSLVLAIGTVVVFIGAFLGLRAAMVVGLAIPVCYGITLALDYSFGYTINRVTLFALILSLGLLVDDPITGVDNIERALRDKTRDKFSSILHAIHEVKTALIMSTLTIIMAFVPLAFITGMMGPYMAPMAFNVPVAVIVSTVVAFTVTPWLSAKLLKPAEDQADDKDAESFKGYRRFIRSVITSRRKSKQVIYGVVILFMLAVSLPALRLVPLKLLPFDNKNELQVLIDLPEGAPLETTNQLAETLSREVLRLPEVTAVGGFVGDGSPIDFSGMVRGYQYRQASHQADLRIILVDKTEREHQSHGILLRLRELLAPYNVDGAKIKVMEVPPGPPVMSTLVAEIYGSRDQSYADLEAAAATVAERLEKEPLVVEVDTSVSDDRPLIRFVVDKEKAALSGISTEQVAAVIDSALKGQTIGYVRDEQEVDPLPINLRLKEGSRDHLADLKSLQVQGSPALTMRTNADNGLENGSANIVSLGELGTFVETTVDHAIYHKNLRPVVYVMADVSGRTPGEIIADVSSDLGQPDIEQTDWHDRSFINNGGTAAWSLPQDIEVNWSGEGEWRITIRVFRDMGLAFMFALAAIYILLLKQTGSNAITGIIMSSIPLTMIGIMPGFWLLNQFGERSIAGAPDPVLFTATAMIGMIALAGIVIRNALIMIEFIHLEQSRGASLQDALVNAGALRMRPILLTAGTTLLGNIVIMLDPVFSGLALAITFGIIASTALTLVVVPVVYAMVYSGANEKGSSS